MALDKKQSRKEGEIGGNGGSSKKYWYNKAALCLSVQCLSGATLCLSGCLGLSIIMYALFTWSCSSPDDCGVKVA